MSEKKTNVDAKKKLPFNLSAGPEQNCGRAEKTAEMSRNPADFLEIRRVGDPRMFHFFSPLGFLLIRPF